MILIGVSWLILLYFFLSMGVTVEFLLKIKTENSILTIILGMISQTFLLTIAAFFTSIGLEFFILNFVLTTFLALYFRKRLSERLYFLNGTFQSFPIAIKWLFIILCLLSLFKCAQYPFILDNESYYVQTMHNGIIN